MYVCLWEIHRRASPAVWDHTVLPVTRHRWTRPTISPARQTCTWFTYPEGMKGWVDLGVGYIGYQDGLPARRQSSIQVVTTWSWSNRKLNPRPHDHKFKVLPLCHLCVSRAEWRKILSTVDCGKTSYLRTTTLFSMLLKHLFLSVTKYNKQNVDVIY